MAPLGLYTLRHLMGRPMSTAFALLSMALVSFTIASLSSIGVGLSQVFDTDEARTLVLVHEHDTAEEWESHMPVEEIGRIVEGVQRYSVETLLYASLSPRPGERVDWLQIRGLDPVGPELHHASIILGRMPAADSEELIVGDALWKHYPGRLSPGMTLEVHRKYHFNIVGVFHTGTPLDNEVWTWRATINRRENEEQLREVSVVYLETPNAQEAHAIADRLAHERGLRVDSAVASEWRAANASKAFKPLYRWLILIDVLIALGVLLAAASQLTIVLLRRTSDMTVLRVLGFPFRRIVRLIVTEVEILAIVGGGLGLVAATIAVRGLSLQAMGPGVDVNFEPQLNLPIFVGTLITMVMIGLLGATIPIVRLARSQLAQALR